MDQAAHWKIWSNTGDGNESRNSICCNKKVHILNFRSSCENLFHFRVVYDELGFFNEWKQTNDPTEPGPAVGFKGLAELKLAVFEW
jgi:hypothetical protein